MFRNIQVLRAVAALAVVFNHIQLRFSDNFGWPPIGFGGRAGVDIFFVISGFIMFHTTRNGERTTAQFWLDRVIRIVPMYWFALLFVALLFFAGLHPIDVKQMGFVDLSEDMAFLPHYRADGEAYPVLDVGWTLIYEMYFYLLFGLTFFFRSQAKSLAVLSGLFLVTAVARDFVHLPHALDYIANPITLEFAAGGALALLFRRDFTMSKTSLKTWGWVVLLAGSALLIVAGVLFGKDVVWNAPLRVEAFGIPAVMIVAGALLLEKAGVSNNGRTLLLLGAASYSIYLIHQLVLQLVLQPLSQAFPDLNGALIALSGVGAFVLAAAAGIAVHLWIEKPVTAALQAFVRNRRKKTPPVTFGATAD